VSKSFGELRVLDGVDLAIEPGRITVVLGPSGTGKSVLLKHIVGLIRPDRGEVWFHGQRIDRMPERALAPIRRRVGYLFQMGALFDSMTVAENICFPMVEQGDRDRRKQRERCARVLELVGLAGIEARLPAELSGGQRKRVALARAIVLEPELILYDEPTTGLDPVRSAVIDELIISLTRYLETTSVVVTHDIESARKIADRIVMLYDGKFIADGTPAEIIHSEHEFVNRFMKGKAEQEDLDLIEQAMGRAAGRAAAEAEEAGDSPPPEAP